MKLQERLGKFISLYQQISSFHEDDLFAALELEITRAKLADIFVRCTPVLNQEEAPEQLKLFEDFLNERWERIRNSNLAYPQAPHHPLNQLCIALSHALAPALGKSAGQLLMPTLKAATSDLTMAHIDALHPREYTLTDEDDQFLEIVATLQSAEVDGVVKKPTPKLVAVSPTEQQRLIHHSSEALAYYEAVQELITVKKHNGSFGSHLFCLILRLQNGGVTGERDGTEEKEGQDVDVGLVNFKLFLDTLSEEEKKFLLGCKKSEDAEETLGDVWHRLANPIDKNLDESYCAYLSSIEIDSILQANQDLFRKKPAAAVVAKVENFDNLVRNQAFAKKQLEEKIKKDTYAITSSYGQERLALKLLSSENLKIAGVKQLRDKKIEEITDVNTLAEYFLKIPKVARLKWIKFIGIQQFEHLIKKYRDLKDDFLLKLPEQDRFQFISMFNPNQLRSLLENEYYFKSLLSDVPQNKRFALCELLGVEKLSSFVRDGYQLKQFLTLFSNEDYVRIFALLGANHLKSIIRDKFHFNAVFSVLNEGQTACLFDLLGCEYVASLMTNGRDLASAMKGVPNQQRNSMESSLALQYAHQIFQDKKRLLRDVMRDVDRFKECKDLYKYLLQQVLDHFYPDVSNNSFCFFANRATKAANALRHVIHHQTETSQQHKLLLAESGVAEVYKRWQSSCAI